MFIHTSNSFIYSVLLDMKYWMLVQSPKKIIFFFSIAELCPSTADLSASIAMSMFVVFSPHAQSFHGKAPSPLNQIPSQVKNHAVIRDAFKTLSHLLHPQAVLPSYKLSMRCTKEAKALFKTPELKSSASPQRRENGKKLYSTFTISSWKK